MAIVAPITATRPFQEAFRAYDAAVVLRDFAETDREVERAEAIIEPLFEEVIAHPTYDLSAIISKCSVILAEYGHGECPTHLVEQIMHANAVQEQMIEVFLAWRHGKLEQQVAAHQLPAISREVTVTGLNPEALGQVGGVFRNVVRKRDAELLEEINRSFQARVFGYIETSLPLIDDYVTGLVDDALDRYVSRQPGLDPIVRAVEQRLAERVAQDEGPVVLAPMATYRGQRCQAVELPALPRTDLRAWRIAKGWTLRQVAEKIGLPVRIAHSTAP